MRWARTTCLLVLVAACQEPPDDGIRSGSRLRAVFLADAEGTRQFETFHDTGLGIDCSFQGEPLRCLPDVARVRDYLDPGCSEPVYSRGITDSCNPPPIHMGIAIEDACSQEPRDFRRIWKVGERVVPETVYVFDAGFCVPREARIDYEYYAADFELPVDDFVAATRELEAGADRLRDVVLLGEDGSQQWIGFHDGDFGVDCSHHTQLAVCVPQLADLGYWSDPSCTEPLAAWLHSTCSSPPSFVGSYSADGQLEQVFGRDEWVIPDRVYTLAGASCTGRLPGSSRSYFPPGENVTDQLAPLDGRVPGSGRLLAYRTGGFHDRVQGLDCEAVPTGTGQWHCLPGSDATAVELYADPLCEQLVVVFELLPPAKASHGLVWRPTGDSCEQHARVHEVGSEIDSGDLYVPRLLGCDRLTWNPAELGYYAVGGEVGLDEYVRLKRVTE
jgi:hypothetical protein